MLIKASLRRLAPQVTVRGCAAGTAHKYKVPGPARFRPMDNNNWSSRSYRLELRAIDSSKPYCLRCSISRYHKKDLTYGECGGY